MKYDGREVANFILDYCEAIDIPVTNLALQKLMYFCHAWCLVSTGKPLLKQQFQAWKFGPVVEHVYNEFKAHKESPIKTRAKRMDFVLGDYEEVHYEFDANTLSIIKSVINFYGRLPAYQLVELSHAQDSPWCKVWNNTKTAHAGMKISNKDIKEFYSHFPFPQQLQ